MNESYVLNNLPSQQLSILQKGKIINIEGVGDKDTYNPVLCDYGGQKILAFRCENRNSQIFDTNNYHPSIRFAKQDENHTWRVIDSILPFDMLEDPTFMEAKIHGNECIVFGGVRAKLLSENNVLVNTELYKGSSLETLERKPFAIINGMKDEHLCQLPDGRFLLCRRPLDSQGVGSIVIHILDNLHDVASVNAIIPPAVAILKGLNDDDWVGINNIYLLTDKFNIQWVGLLGHMASKESNGVKHYVATTYKIKLDELINGQSNNMKANIIATRSCFEDGPQKDNQLGDIVFPGCLEKIGDNRYRLWAGLSDARIGVVDLDDPFKFN